ncbi:hemerythrin [Leptospira ognonensis]|uniref:Hemerythrin n=1 Tax=Leptospira ognonensis TaxID=2484945 RepID=A0A4R9K271_9LEPT|nr:bacteriohemerythrin [Leptospira ognonensis]TGL60093.1 hemerythrin [Leptospira ognonensis]
MPKDPAKKLEELKNLWFSQPFSLGIPIIDLQHLWLVYTILNLEEALTDVTLESFSDDVKLSFTRALEYVSEHFALEEDILSHFNYPNFEQHVEGHRNFVAKLAEKFSGAENDEVAALGLLQILKKWLFQHILHDDADYADFFNKQDIKVNKYSNQILKERKYTISKDQLLIYQNISAAEESTQVQTSESSDIVQDIRKIWRTYNLATNIPIIDLQHMWLLKMIVELDKILASGNVTNEVLHNIIVQAIDYTKDHFSVEDRIMRQFRYVDFANHMKQHKRFIDFVQLRSDENKKGDRLVAAHLIQDLKNWLLSHIAFEDRKLGIAFKDRVRELSDFTKKLHQNGEVSISAEQKNLYKAVLERNSDV